MLRTRTIWSEYEEGEGEARVPEMTLNPTLNPTLKRHTYSTCLRVYLSEYARSQAITHRQADLIGRIMVSRPSTANKKHT